MMTERAARPGKTKRIGIMVSVLGLLMPLLLRIPRISGRGIAVVVVSSVTLLVLGGVLVAVSEFRKREAKNFMFGVVILILALVAAAIVVHEMLDFQRRY